MAEKRLHGTEREDCFSVVELKIVFGVGIFIVAVGILILVLELLFHTERIPLWVYAVIFAIIMSGVALCMDGKNRRLEIDGTRFCYVNFLNRRREFSLDGIGYVKALSDYKKGQDYIRLYSKTGEKLCKLESNMVNALMLVSLLHESGIVIDTPEDGGNLIADIVMQERIAEESVNRTAQKAYEETSLLINAWLEKNRKTGADFYYGLAQYHGERIEPKAEVQPQDSRCYLREGERLPEDYICVMEIYIKKNGLFVRDRKGKLMVMIFPLLYKRKLMRPVAGEAETAVYYNKNYLREIEETLESLQQVLPGHKFTMEQMNLGYELAKSIY